MRVKKLRKMPMENSRKSWRRPSGLSQAAISDIENGRQADLL